MEKMEHQLRERFRLGWIVFAALIVFTLVEYGVALIVLSGAPLLVALVLFQAADAGLILWYFMHVAQLWRGYEA